MFDTISYLLAYKAENRSYIATVIFVYFLYSVLEFAVA